MQRHHIQRESGSDCDPAVLYRLAEDGGGELLQLLLEDFRASVAAMVHVIEQAQQQELFDDVEYAAHSLKGTAKALGMNAFAVAAGQVEQAARGGAFSSLQDAATLRRLAAEGEDWMQGIVGAVLQEEQALLVPTLSAARLAHGG